MVLGVSQLFDLNLSPSHCSTCRALQNKNMNALHDAWVSLDDTDYTSSDLLKVQLETENKNLSLYIPNTEAMIQVHHMRYII